MHTQNFTRGLNGLSALKVPKREIFDRSDFPDFYTIKSLSVGDFGVKIKKNFKNISGGHLGVQSSLRICSVYF
jgi:hypothetical protein